MKILSFFKDLPGFLYESGRQFIEPIAYSAAIGAYRAGVGLASFRNPKAKKLREGEKRVWDTLRASLDPAAKYIWVHASSLGEFEQGRPLMERIRRECPEYKIILTFFSPSGYEVRKNYEGADIVTYLPFDLPGNARRFVETVRPEKAFFIKYEFWRNYLKELAAHNIPTYLISGIFRPGQMFFRKGMSGYRAWLRWFTKMYLQDEGSRRLLARFGITDTVVAGDTRFDRVTDIMRGRKEIPEIENFVKDSPFTLCAGSSWPEDEAVYFPWLGSHSEVKAIIAPHEFDEARIKKIKESFPGEAVTLSELRSAPDAMKGKRILIIDCFGLLSSLYVYADAAFIGGAFGAGLHNINEAAVYGIPVVFGPRHGKFIEAREIIGARGGFSVSDREEGIKILDSLLADKELLKTSGEAAGKYIAGKLGATDRIFSDIFRK